jgi:hypothetical protein
MKGSVLSLLASFPVPALPLSILSTSPSEEFVPQGADNLSGAGVKRESVKRSETLLKSRET